MNQQLLRVGDEVWYDRSTSAYSSYYTRGIVQDLKLDSYGHKQGRPDHVRIRRLHTDGSEWNYPAKDDEPEKPVIDLVHSRRVDDLWDNKKVAIAAQERRDEWAQMRDAADGVQMIWLEQAFAKLDLNLEYKNGTLQLSSVTHQEAPTEQGSRATSYNRLVSWINVAHDLAKKLKVKLPPEPEVIWETHPDFLEDN